tara:strand:+ start:1836 stop:2360 length:525 start_codon:yes stop_codon:yes gene_type:complete
MREFSCDFCIYRKLYSRRTCFLYDEFPDGSEGKARGDFFAIPRFEPDGGLTKDERTGRPESEIRFLEADELLSETWEINQYLPQLSAFQILRAYFPDVCPTSFIDEVCMSIIGAQSNAKDYGIDLTNENSRRDLLGFHMTLPDTLEAFDIVMSTRNAYERYEMEKLEQANKKSA